MMIKKHSLLETSKEGEMRNNDKTNVIYETTNSQRRTATEEPPWYGYKSEEWTMQTKGLYETNRKVLGVYISILSFGFVLFVLH